MKNLTEQKITEKRVSEMIEVGLWFEELFWHEHANGIFVCSSTVQFDSDTILELKGSVNQKTGSYKWMLFLNGQRIVALENHSRHHNPTCSWIDGVHLHWWRDEYQSERYAEKVDFDNSDDPEIAFYWFARQLNIRVRRGPGSVPDVVMQGRF